MRQEIVDLRQAVEMVRILLEHDTEFTSAEEREINSCAGTLRSHWNLWDQRRKTKRKAT